MKQYLLMLLVASGLLALIPTESKAQVVISVRPAIRLFPTVITIRAPYYHHGYSHRYYRYNHDSVIIAGTGTITTKKSSRSILQGAPDGRFPGL